ncbi:hypothetical protein [Streptomyces sp. NPDC093089]|uniref:hypothetical protein n=1 Tax=Streptomyces sp. NPDC093089 TaxID=3366024 RepID=UPI0037F6003E
MEWITAENVIALGTALLGVLVSVGVVWLDRFSPQRKRLGYRVQLHTPLHREDNRDSEVVGRAAPANGSTLVLHRNEPANSSQDCVTRDDPEAKVIRCALDSTEQVLPTVAALPGAIGYAELRASDGRKGLHKVAVDGRRPVVEEIGTSGYPYREIEYAYTWGRPPASSLTASFLTCLGRGSGQDVVLAHGHLPCSTPKGLRVCGEG